MRITIRPSLRAPVAAASPRARAVADLFDLDAPAAPAPIAPVCIPIRGLILLTGPSGAGKSTLLRRVATALRRRGLRLADASRPAPAERAAALVDAFPELPLPEALALLARAGLAEARLLLGRPADLSDGQRARFRLACAMASGAPVLLADEFAATLDRISARALAYNLRRWIDQTARTALLATAHEDLLADLRPDVHLRVEPGRIIRAP